MTPFKTTEPSVTTYSLL